MGHSVSVKGPATHAGSVSPRSSPAKTNDPADYRRSVPFLLRPKGLWQAAA